MMRPARAGSQGHRSDMVANGERRSRSPDPDAKIITMIWAALVEAVVAVEEDERASVQVAPVRSCDAPSPQRSAAKLGPSLGYRENTYPTRAIFPDCCASAASGAASTAPRPVTKVRRSIIR